MKSNVFLKRYEKLGMKIKLDIKLEKSFRVNTLRIKENDLIKRLTKKRIKLEKVEWLDNGYIYRSYFSLGSTPEYLSGYYFLQELASQIVAEVLDPKNETILDMTASPGAKSTHIAQLMKNKGTLVCLEKNKKRSQALVNNLQRCGVKNSIVYNIDAIKVENLNMKFDKVLLDAPCSGNFTSEEKWFEKRDMEGVQKNAKLQRELLTSAMSVLKKDGILVYSTCSLEPEENEMNIEWLMDKFNVKLETIDIKNGVDGLTKVFGNKLRPEIKKTKRFWPGETQGFFIAKIIKK